MSIMEIKQVGYSYDNKKKVLKGVNAEMEQGKLYAILGPSAAWTAPAAARFTSMGRTLPRRGFPTTGKTMWRLFSRRTT